jgi:Tfp pilus assembly protein PilO
MNKRSFLALYLLLQNHALMSDNNNSKLLMAFLAGAAVGVAVGYFLNSDKKDELVEDLKEGATRLKHTFEEGLGKVKDIVDAFTDEEFETETETPAKS